MNDIARIRQAVRSTAYDEALAEHLGLNATDFRCLEHAIAEPGLTPGRLAELSGLTTGAVTGVLDRLERAGFVERRPGPADRRSVTVQPSPTRSVEVHGAGEPLDRAIHALLGKYSPAERSAIAVFVEAAAAVVAEETARLRTGSRGGFQGNVYTAPLGEAARGRLVFVSGAPRLALNVAPLGPQAAARMIMETSASRLGFWGAAPAGDLVRATFSGPLPDVRVSGGVVTVRYRRSALAAFATRAAKVTLSGAIPWSIEILGGLTDLDGSLAGVMLSRLEVADGANHIDLVLPAPSGTIAVAIAGVASSVRLRRPAGAAVGLRVAGGISHLRLDGTKHENVAGERRFTSPGYAGATDRYEIEINGGASDVRIAGT
ncbi:MAG: MarR family transcriptional regulator [Chloroflexota bacterium]